jgi:protein TonB
MKAGSPFLPAAARAAALAPWCKSVLIVGLLHGAAAGAIMLGHLVAPQEADEFGAEGVVELTALTLPAESAHSPETIDNEAEDRPETRKQDRAAAEDRPEVPLEPIPVPVPDRAFALPPPEPEAAPRPEPERVLPPAEADSTASLRSVAMAAMPEIRGEEAETPQPAPAGNLPDARQRLEAWQKRLLAHIGRFRQYPEAARATRLQGEILVAFRIDGAGAVSELRVVRPSGHAPLDNAALDVIRRAAPMPKPPEIFAATPLDLMLPLRFSLK